MWLEPPSGKGSFRIEGKYNMTTEYVTFVSEMSCASFDSSIDFLPKVNYLCSSGFLVSEIPNGMSRYKYIIYV